MSPTTKLCLLCEGIIHDAGPINLTAGCPAMWLTICDDCEPREPAQPPPLPAFAGHHDPRNPHER